MKGCALSVLGAGSYGTALAMAVASKGLRVVLWGRSPGSVLKMQQERENQRYLPGIKFPETLSLTSGLEEAVTASEVLLLVVPSHTFSAVLKEIDPFLNDSHRLFWATKGIDPESGELLGDVAARTLTRSLPLAAISGPTFARELALGLPTAISAAGTSPEFTREICALMHTPTFRIYESHDFKALQLGGTVKNVIAIGCGLSDGLGYGANARTALISRGLVEMIRFGVAFGTSEHSFQGLSGLGDLILTCTDDQSRNRRFGYMLGQGLSVAEALAKIGQVVEGYTMTAVMERLRKQYDVQMPICEQLYQVIYNGKSGREASRDLMAREQKAE